MKIAIYSYFRNDFEYLHRNWRILAYYEKIEGKIEIQRHRTRKLGRESELKREVNEEEK